MCFGQMDLQLIALTVLLMRPWVLISVNDDEDLHFRKAEIQASLLWFNL